MEYEVKEVFEYKGNNVAVVEAKDFLLKRFKVNKKQVQELEIDTRIFTCIGGYSEEGKDIDYVIYVYCYDTIKEDNEFNKAILYHELGHITYPPTGEIGQEITCDIYSAKECGAEVILRVLSLTVSEMGRLGKNTKELRIREITMEAYIGKY